MSSSNQLFAVLWVETACQSTTETFLAPKKSFFLGKLWHREAWSYYFKVGSCPKKKKKKILGMTGVGCTIAFYKLCLTMPCTGLLECWRGAALALLALALYPSVFPLFSSPQILLYYTRPTLGTGGCSHMLWTACLCIPHTANWE